MKSKNPIAKKTSDSSIVPIAEPRKAFSDEFREAAVMRMRHGEQNVTDLALELGVRRNQLYKWAAKLDAKGPAASFAGPGRPKGSKDSALAKLTRELDKAKQEIAILKKFNACLAQLKK
jgi:transposase